MERFAVYGRESLGYPLVFNSFDGALDALIAMDAFDGLNIHQVYHYRGSRYGGGTPMYPNSQPGGFGGVFRDSQEREIVLGKPLVRGLQLAALRYYLSLGEDTEVANVVADIRRFA